MSLYQPRNVIFPNKFPSECKLPKITETVNNKLQIHF